MDIASISDHSKENIEYWQQLATEHPYCNVAQFMEHYSQYKSISPELRYLYRFNPASLAIHFSSDIASPSVVTHTDNKKTPAIELAAVDYYQSQGVEVSHELPSREELPQVAVNNRNDSVASEPEDVDKSLLVQMTFRDWLIKITETKRKEKEEQQEQEALRLKWKQQKLADAIQEENDEIPDQVFRMAVESIEQEEAIPSESLAEVYLLQKKWDKAVQIYQKLILLFPEKKTYFANKIEQIKKSI